MSKSLSEKLYDFIFQNDGKRIGTGIRDSAVDAVPGNFVRLLSSSILTKIGDALSKPGVLLTWMLGTLGAPAMVIGLVVPIREAGSLLLQLFVGELVQQREIRKYFWVTGSLIQGGAVLGMVPAVLFLEGATAGWLIVGLLAVFSLARGICSVTSKDLVGRAIPKTQRGRLSGIAASISGVVAIGVGVWLLFYKGERLQPSIFATILGVAGFLWLLAAGVMFFLKEPKTEASESGNPLQKIRESLKLLKTDPEFRLFCISRALLSGTVLSMPFYVILAREATDGSSRSPADRRQCCHCSERFCVGEIRRSFQSPHISDGGSCCGSCRLCHRLSLGNRNVEDCCHLFLRWTVLSDWFGTYRNSAWPQNPSH